MIITLHLILVVATLVCFACAAIGKPPTKINLIALGLFFLTLLLVLK